MPLSPGTRVGAYEIVAPIGAGGMGEVYRAHDTKLGRDVALKVLPESLAHDADRMARFEREAQVLASLNHPNIASIFGVEERALVMELVEGPTLADRIAQGPIPLAEALSIAKQIAAGLDYAHEKGIVHRDLKPANVKITGTDSGYPDHVKLLDFGLAKALSVDSVSGDPVSSPTLTMNATMAGMILGTAAYMSPEQARGSPVDRRADIWAFGVVLYEMFTGRPMFAEETVSETLAAVLKTNLDWSALPADLPAPVRRLLRRCLERDRRRRLRDIGDALAEIEEAAAAPPEETRPAEFPAAWQPKAIWGLAALVLVVAGLAVWAWFRAPTPVPQPVMRWSTTLPHANPVPGVRLSADGTRLTYLGSTSGWSQIFMRPMDQLEARPITGNDGVDYIGQFFSPDGRWIAYQSAGKLKKVPAAGGASSTIADAPPIYGGTWGSDDTIVIGGWAGQPLLRIPAAGGKLEALTKLDPKKGEIQHDWPYFLPNSKGVLFSVRTAGGNWDNARIDVVNLRTGEQRTLIEGGSNPRYARTGHLLYAHSGSLFAVPFDGDKLQLKGSAVPVLEGVSWSAGTGYADYSFSDSGDLVYVARSTQADSASMLWVDRKGNAEALPAPIKAYSNPSLSPDGKRIAVSVANPGGDWDIWVFDIERHTLSRLTFKGFNFAPVWTPDGKRITFRCRETQNNGICWTASDNSGPAERLVESGMPATPGSWLPDGSALLYYRGLPQGTEPWILPLQGDRKPRQLEPRFAITPQISPDGQWMAYSSSESGTVQVYVQPFPGPGGKWQISTEGGMAPRWSRNGRELFYRNGDKMMAVDIESKPVFRAGVPRVLFEGHYETSPAGLQPGAGYDVSADGKRFLMVKSAETQAAPGEVQVVHNWFEELRRRVPTGAQP